MIDGRFFWAPVLEKLSRCVALNAQLTSVDGSILDDGKINIMVEGLAAGREPRAAAEELRQLLLEQLGQSYNDVKVEFRTLEDLDTMPPESSTEDTNRPPENQRRATRVLVSCS